MKNNWKIVFIKYTKTKNIKRADIFSSNLSINELIKLKNIKSSSNFFSLKITVKIGSINAILTLSAIELNIPKKR